MWFITRDGHCYAWVIISYGKIKYRQKKILFCAVPQQHRNAIKKHHSVFLVEAKKKNIKSRSRFHRLSALHYIQRKIFWIFSASKFLFFFWYKNFSRIQNYSRDLQHIALSFDNFAIIKNTWKHTHRQTNTRTRMKNLFN